eukprot:TRINITY_DN5569_c0_g1_i1.p1 TRINITY_DN5569_c0_g1~~TRINITY_DN5569_c0_g1_i1.p1  ORF type:complete len:296 (+),score=54.54 TRINITY_DN5569_c0_g1_i1:222-1109(+)
MFGERDLSRSQHSLRFSSYLTFDTTNTPILTGLMTCMAITCLTSIPKTRDTPSAFFKTLPHHRHCYHNLITGFTDGTVPPTKMLTEPSPDSFLKLDFIKPEPIATPDLTEAPKPVQTIPDLLDFDSSDAWDPTLTLPSFSIKVPSLVVKSGAQSTGFHGRVDASFTFKFSPNPLPTPLPTPPIDCIINPNPPLTSPLCTPLPSPRVTDIKVKLEPFSSKPQQNLHHPSRKNTRKTKKSGLRDVFESEKVMLKCRHCSKKFGRNLHRQQHERSHTGIRPHACFVDGCNKRFKQNRI